MLMLPKRIPLSSFLATTIVIFTLKRNNKTSFLVTEHLTLMFSTGFSLQISFNPNKYAWGEGHTGLWNNSMGSKFSHLTIKCIILILKKFQRFIFEI